jgi:hypothetical protein
LRYTLVLYQNTEARNGISQQDEDVFLHATGDIVAELSTTASVGGEES